MLLATIMTGNYIECIWVGTANLKVAFSTSGILLIWQISIRAIICSGKYAFMQSSVLANIHWETAYSGKCQWWQMSVHANELRADRLLQSVIVQSSGYLNMVYKEHSIRERLIEISGKIMDPN